MYFPYERMSTQVSDGVHDTESVATNCKEFQRVGDDFDMRNYFMYKQLSPSADMSEKMYEANRAMWMFQLSCVVQRDDVPRGEWKMCLSRSIKLVGVYLHSSGELQVQYDKRVIRGSRTLVFPFVFMFQV